MTEKNQSIRTNLAKAKGAGSARNGTDVWMAQRIAALPLIPLFVYFITQLKYITSGDITVVTAWIKLPVNTIALVVLILCGFYHAYIGVSEIITDYVSSKGKFLVTSLLNRAVFLLLTIASIFAILAINFGA